MIKKYHNNLENNGKSWCKLLVSGKRK